MHAFFSHFKRNFPSTNRTIFMFKHESSANTPMNQLQRNDFLVQLSYGLLNFDAREALNYH